MIIIQNLWKFMFELIKIISILHFLGRSSFSLIILGGCWAILDNSAEKNRERNNIFCVEIYFKWFLSSFSLIFGGECVRSVGCDYYTWDDDQQKNVYGKDNFGDGKRKRSESNKKFPEQLQWI